MIPSNRCLVFEMELTAVIVLILVTAFLSVLLRRYQPELALGVGILAGILVLTSVVKTVVPTLRTVQTLLENASVPTAYAAILFKGLGICLLTQLAGDACRDAGETALANKTELVGKILLLTVALPLFEEIVNLALSLMQR